MWLRLQPEGIRWRAGVFAVHSDDARRRVAARAIWSPLMSHDEAVKFFAEQQEEWNARDADALARRHTPDGTVISPIFRTVQGIDEILGSYRRFLTGTTSVKSRWWMATAIGSPRNSSCTRPIRRSSWGCWDRDGSSTSRVRMFEMKDGLIAYERRYYDFTGLLIQLGVLRGKPAR